MSITSALYTGVSGLINNGESMNVIGNNLANVNTIGFKGGRTLFSDMLSASIGNGSQVGRGMQLQRVENLFTQGGFENTENVTDLALQGNSFFALGKPEGNVQVTSQNSAFLTRAGAFHVDSGNYLVNPEGYQVLDTEGNPIRFNDNAAAITAAANAYNTAVSTASANATQAATDAMTTASAGKAAADAALTAANDALTAANAMPETDAAAIALKNAAVTAATNAVTQATNAVTVADTAMTNATALSTAAATFAAAATALAANPNADNSATANAASLALANAFTPAMNTGNALQAALSNAGGALSTYGAGAGYGGAAAAATAGTAATTASTTAATDASTASTSINTATTSNSAATTAYTPVSSAASLAFAKVLKVEPNGLISYLAKDGITQLYYNNNSTVGLATTPENALIVQRVAVVTPIDSNGLEKVGSTMFKATGASGVPTTGFSLGSNTANATTEKILSNSLEMSNVDMASQFVKMITTQRAYSANSKTITTTDEMMQEVLQLKR